MLPPYPLHFLVGIPRLTSQSEHPSHELTLCLGRGSRKGLGGSCRGKGMFLLVPEGPQIGLAFRDGWPLPSRCNTLLLPSGQGQDKHQPELQLAPLQIAEGTSPDEDRPGKPQDLVIRGPSLRAQLTAVPALAFQRAVGPGVGTVGSLAVCGVPARSLRPVQFK